MSPLKIRPFDKERELRTANALLFSSPEQSKIAIKLTADIINEAIETLEKDIQHSDDPLLADKYVLYKRQ